MLKTNYTKNWNVEIDQVLFGGDEIEYIFGIPVDFNPSLPYIYLPDLDYNTTVDLIKKKMPGIDCSYMFNYCRF